MREDWLEITAAGTVQDLHLFPSRGLNPSPKIAAKILFFSFPFLKFENNKCELYAGLQQRRAKALAFTKMHAFRVFFRLPHAAFLFTFATAVRGRTERAGFMSA